RGSGPGPSLCLRHLLAGVVQVRGQREGQRGVGLVDRAVVAPAADANGSVRVLGPELLRLGLRVGGLLVPRELADRLDAVGTAAALRGVVPAALRLVDGLVGPV